ncbi:FAD-binding and (Fe-S)-binding domain-containing protein [Psychromonas ossibalaenae]|uniref:FAD-binding and (Fe-S)-binding domain-containing protein n=1 Tax=Psychromonas ossibalaenae TaxID=444922 RepID=UPI0003766867|nr:FAD-binding and (Fe-S)-binding domain-containing protein [Psychromonas ossibalaenae]
MEKRYLELIKRISTKIDSSRIISDPALLFAYGGDASFYRLTPQLIVQLDNIDEVILVIVHCAELSIAVTFRAAGTSLSGQALSDSLLITLTSSWNNFRISTDGAKISLQPGIIGTQANQYLAPYGRKIGPDPASIDTCKIGGIAANNSSGMCCGTAHNSYNTLAGMTVVLSDGTVLNTLDEDSISDFKYSRQTLLDDLSMLAETCTANKKLSAKIRHKYRLKNTTGYGINALIDFQDPIDILQHLMIGSEGTLGFIAEITYHSVADPAFKACGLFVFNNIENTCLAVSELQKTSVAAVELMDNRSLQSVADKAGMPDFIKKLDNESAALLIEIQTQDALALQQQQSSIMELINIFDPVHYTPFSQDKKVSEQLWAVRKGLFPAVGAVRETGTTVIIEDIAFPTEQLAAAVRDLHLLFKHYHYHEAIIFGHALDGNLHFVFTQAFETEQEILCYRDFMQDVALLTAVQYKGSLKAEHGTGRNMAPYVELEWGSEGYALMRRIKQIFDPENIFNPGVIINEDKQVHLKNLKAMPAADTLIDKCIECGFCEPVCPSRNLTLTPRQRNSLYREICRLQRSGENPRRLAELRVSFKYYGIDTCAATGLCADRCPVDINSGDLILKLRQEHSSFQRRIAHCSAQHFSAVCKSAQLGLQAADTAHTLLGSKRMSTVSKALHQRSKQHLPLWSVSMPRPAGKMPLKINAVNREKVVYFPSCAARNMGGAKNSADPRPLVEVTLALLNKAGYQVIIPEELNTQCCGMPYRSKGFTDIYKDKSRQLEQVLQKASKNGKYPVLMDTSPCAALSKKTFTCRVTIFEPFQFIDQYVLPKLRITTQTDPVMLHITCSSWRSGLASIMHKVTKACAQTVIIPDQIDCCGFAGDKGFTYPELNASALAPLKSQIPDNCSEGYSNSRTCEIGLSEHSGIEYRSILYLVDKVSR